MNSIESFKDLHAWQAAYGLVLKIYKLTKTFPREELFGLSSQMRRSAVSVTSNIAEGFGRKSWKEKLYFYRIARGSLIELHNQLIIAQGVGHASQENIQDIELDIERVHKLVNGLISSCGTKLANK
ncbi:MAG: four helix bundle protein [Patescibacteria group bacterium]|nr:four helix bundle protein [Patescibacteria group bacterium]MBU2509214.1 four helix bundle protein [Patescibacteria group bacterium]